MSGVIEPGSGAAFAAALSKLGGDLVVDMVAEVSARPFEKALDDLASLAEIYDKSLRIEAFDHIESGPPSHKSPSHVAFQRNPTSLKRRHP